MCAGGTNEAIADGRWHDSATWRYPFSESQQVTISDDRAVVASESILTPDLRLGIANGSSLTFSDGTAFMYNLLVGSVYFFGDDRSFPGQSASAAFSGGRTFFDRIELKSKGDAETNSTLLVSGNAVVSVRELSLAQTAEASERGSATVRISGIGAIVVNSLSRNDVTTQQIEISEGGALVIAQNPVYDASFGGLVRSTDGTLRTYHFGNHTVIANEGLVFPHLMSPPEINVIQMVPNSSWSQDPYLILLTSLNLERIVSIQYLHPEYGWRTNYGQPTYGAGTAAMGSSIISGIGTSGIFRAVSD